MKCIECANADLQKHKDMARLGYMHCPLMGAGAFRSIHCDKACDQYLKASTEVIEKRVVWAIKAGFFKGTE